MTPDAQKARGMSHIALPGLVDPHDLSLDRHFSMNLARGMGVLRVFTPTEPLLGNRELSERTGLPKATVSRLTYTLTLLGYLTHDQALQKYRLGSGVLSMCHPLLASMAVRQAARPLMEQLARKTGCTVNMGIRDRSSVVYVDTVRADAANRYLPDIGSNRPLLAGSIGRALILARPPAEQAAILNHLKVHDAALFETYRPAWEADVKRFAAHGYCHARGDWHSDVHGVSAPVRLSPHEIPIALSCTLSGPRIPEGKLETEVVPVLLETVQRIETTQGVR